MKRIVVISACILSFILDVSYVSIVLCGFLLVKNANEKKIGMSVVIKWIIRRSAVMCLI